MSVHPATIGNVNETAAELADLQALLDRSAAGPKRHLTDIASPARQLSAAQLAAGLVGIVVLNIATVTASGAPRLSAVDGQFLHAHWYFSTAAAAVKARHLAVRPAVSVSYTPRDGYGVWTHGRAVVLRGAERQRISRYLAAVYDMDVSNMTDEPGGVEIYRVDADWMLAFAMSAEEQASFDAGLPARAERLTTALAELG